MSKQLQRHITQIKGHLLIGNKEAAQRYVDGMLRSAPTEAARKKIVLAVQTLNQGEQK